MPSLFELLQLLTCVPFSCRYLTLAPETAEETYVELFDTEPEGTVSAASTTLPGKGEICVITL